MSRQFAFKDTFKESRLFVGRVAASVAFMLLLTLGLVVRLIFLQVQGHDLYTTLSRSNQVKISPLSPARGMVFDRNGEVLADNVATYSLEVIPEQVQDLPATLAGLKALFGLSNEEIERFEQQKNQRKSFESVPLRVQLTEEEIARFAVKMPWFPGVEVRKRLTRNYPYGNLTAHVVGYVSRISEDELKHLDPAQYRGTLHVGKNGLEKSYESVLHGRTGYEEFETNVQGRALRDLGTTDPVPGADLYLSLDIKLQKIALDGLRGFSGAVVAMEPATGKVLVMASKPSFDPNPFIQGIGKAEYTALNNNPERPLYDRASRGVYPPGSTVKPFVALAGMETIKLSPAQRTSCPGYYRLAGGDHRYRDWKHSGHGSVDMRLAITQSCDVYFYDLARRIGIEKLHDFMAKFGFGQRSGIDLDGEKAGLFPSAEWKEKTRKKPWLPGETVIAGIGQGYVQASPLQMSRATAMLANHGHNVEPRLVDVIKANYEVEKPFPRDHDEPLGTIDPKRWQVVVSAMIDVVHSGRGTAKGIAGGLAYHIAGKTGTAQVFTVGQKQSYGKMAVKRTMRDHAWFIAFAPAEAPRIAVAVIAEHAGHGGTVAAPIARAVMDNYLKTR
jgi:penicillin-binding protein 2